MPADRAARTARSPKPAAGPAPHNAGRHNPAIRRQNPVKQTVVKGTPRWVRLSSLLLSLAGLLVSAYLTLEHYTSSLTLACPESSLVNCQKVTTSAQSAVLGVPVALLGLLFFVAMVVITLPAAWRHTAQAVRRTRIGMTVLGVLFVFYLLYAELFILNSICLWCTAVHILTLALFAVVALGTAADHQSAE